MVAVQTSKAPSIELAANDPGFPSELRGIPRPPKSLFVRGRLPPGLRVAVVGARESDAYGLDWARRLATDLTRNGIVVVSGGASGIDTAALEASLEQDGHPLAVLGTGIDIAYPASNRALFEQVAEHGALISEYPPKTQGFPEHFPERNRLISGLSLGVVVVRAARASGSLITAREALRQGRKLMAVPGAAGDALSAGPHLLLKKGASWVESAEDVLTALGLSAHDIREPTLPFPEETPRFETEHEQLLWTCLASDALDIDGLVERTQLPTAEVLATLIQWEIKGWVRQKAGSCYVRTQAQRTSLTN